MGVSAVDGGGGGGGQKYLYLGSRGILLCLASTAVYELWQCVWGGGGGEGGEITARFVASGVQRCTPVPGQHCS